MGFALKDLHGNCTGCARSHCCLANYSQCVGEGARSDDVDPGHIPLDSPHGSRCKLLEVGREAQAYLCPSGRLQEAVRDQRRYRSRLAKESDSLAALVSWDTQMLDGSQTCQAVELHQPYVFHVLARVLGSLSWSQIDVLGAAVLDERTSWSTSDCLCVCPEWEAL